MKVLIILNQVQVHGFFGDKKMGLLNTMQQAQPQSGLLSGMGMHQPQNPRETEVAKQLATALFQNPTAETVQAVVAKMTQMQMAGTEEIGKILTLVKTGVLVKMYIFVKNGELVQNRPKGELVRWQVKLDILSK